MNLNCRNIFLYGILSLCFLSCKNNDNIFPAVQNASLTIVNATADTLNYYINGTRQNNTSGLFPGGALVNQTVPAGTANYQFKKSGNASVLFSKAITLQYNANNNITVANSIYVYGELPNQNFLVLNDTLVASIANNTATIRFVNLSPDAGSITVSVGIANSGNLTSFNQIAFASKPLSNSISSGLNEIKVFLPNISNPKIDTTINIQPNTINTIFTKGLLKGAGGAAFALGAMVNK